MAVKTSDYRGLHCPLPALKMLSETSKMAPGDILEAVADCPTFEADVRSFCERTKKTLIFFRKEEKCMRCQVRI
jgi:tRNA 2-thiouridine synthesizing protein A